jgi:hypothetical protein
MGKERGEAAAVTRENAALGILILPMSACAALVGCGHVSGLT